MGYRTLLLAFATAAPAWSHGAFYPPPPGSGGPGPGAPLPLPNSKPALTSLPGKQAPAQTGPGDIQPPETGWDTWWRFNQEPLLEVRDAMRAAAAVETGDDQFFLGTGTKRQAVDDGRPTTTEVLETVLPLLERTLAEARDNDLVTGCLIALARIGDDLDARTRGRIDGLLRPFLADGNQTVRETAALALGILGNESTAVLLGDVLHDRRAGRKAVGGSTVGGRTRAFAAYALGLLGNQTEREDVRRYIVHQLALVLLLEPSIDEEAACILALGVVPLELAGTPGGMPAEEEAEHLLPSSSREAQVAFLLDLLDDDRNDRRSRAQVPLSLARLTAGLSAGSALRMRVVDELLRRSTQRSTEPREVLQSIALALGMLGDDDADSRDERIRDRLSEYSRVTADMQARHYALFALARVGGRRGEGEPAGVDDAARHLLRELASGNTDTRSTAALALGVLGRGVSRSGTQLPVSVARGLRLELDSSRTPVLRGACALALGLLSDQKSAPDVRELFNDNFDEGLRGSCALSLGLSRHHQARGELMEVVRNSGFKPLLLRDTATGLGLMGDRDVIPVLTEMLGRAGSLASRAAIATALGRIGDRTAVPSLITLLENERLSSDSRTFAAVALGIVADPDVLPWSTVYSVDANYAVGLESLYDKDGNGLLNIL